MGRLLWWYLAHLAHLHGRYYAIQCMIYASIVAGLFLLGNLGSWLKWSNGFAVLVSMCFGGTCVWLYILNWDIIEVSHPIYNFDDLCPRGINHRVRLILALGNDTKGLPDCEELRWYKSLIAGKSIGFKMASGYYDVMQEEYNRSKDPRALYCLMLWRSHETFLKNISHATMTELLKSGILDDDPLYLYYIKKRTAEAARLGCSAAQIKQAAREKLGHMRIYWDAKAVAQCDHRPQLWKWPGLTYHAVAPRSRYFLGRAFRLQTFPTLEIARAIRHYEEVIHMAKSAIVLWAMDAKRGGMCKDVRRIIIRDVWAHRELWSYASGRRPLA